MSTTTVTKNSAIKVGGKVTHTSAAIDPFADLQGIRAQYASDYEADVSAKSDIKLAIDGRQAALVQRGYVNALELLKKGHRAQLKLLLAEAGIEMARETPGQFRNIAALQLGSKNALGKWQVKAQRDKRLGRYYGIFYQWNVIDERLGKPPTWEPARLADQIAEYPGRFDGIDKAWKKETENPDKAAAFERDCTTVAQHDRGIGIIEIPGRTMANTGARTMGFVLALVSVHNGTGKVHSIYEAQPAIRAALREFIPKRATDLRAEAQGAAAE